MNCNLRIHTKVKVNHKMKRIDTCLAPVIRELNTHFNTRTLACCCGHGIYHETIFLKQNQIILEFYTGLVITPIKRRYLNFYQVACNLRQLRNLLARKQPFVWVEANLSIHIESINENEFKVIFKSK